MAMKDQRPGAAFVPVGRFLARSQLGQRAARGLPDGDTLDAVVTERGAGFAHRALPDEGRMRRIAVLLVP